MITIEDNILRILLKPYMLDISNLEFLGGGREDSDGIVYSYSNGNKKMVFKALSWKCSETEFENYVEKNDERLKFINYAGQNGANIVFPSYSDNGMLYNTYYKDGYGYLTYIMDFVNGKKRGPEEWDEPFYQNWGKTIGKMHRLAKQYPIWQYSQQSNHMGSPLLGWETEWDDINDLHYDDSVKQKWSEIRSLLIKLPKNRDVFGFIHNDPHSENILDDGENLYLIDFDVSNYHWFINDIAIALQSVLFTRSGGMERPLMDQEALKYFLNNMLEGYEKENHLDNEWIMRLDLFIAYRRILLFTILKNMLLGNKELYDSWKGQILESPQYILKSIR